MRSSRGVHKLLLSKGLAVEERAWDNEKYFSGVCSNTSFHREYTRNYPTCQNQFTVMLSSFSKYREQRLKLLIQHYVGMRHVHDVVVVWQDMRQPALDRLKAFKATVKQLKLDKPVTFLKQKVAPLSFAFRLLPARRLTR